MKSTLASIIIVGIVIGSAILLSNNKSVSINESDDSISTEVSNVTILDGKQIITINARGGYSPRTSVAKAGIPTTIRFNTKSTFDCSAFIRIPSLNINKMLPQSGVTDIDLGIPEVTNLYGSCGMGMYPFNVEFR